MTNLDQQITILMSNNGKSAAEITHAIKVLGNGSMQDGLNIISNYFSDNSTMTKLQGVKIGFAQGAVIGGASTAVIALIVYLICKGKNKKNKRTMEEQSNKRIEADHTLYSINETNTTMILALE